MSQMCSDANVMQRQRYSRYLPLYPSIEPKSARKPSLVKDSDAKARKEREAVSRASVDSLTKRRSTMNSRNAYDEEETLRRVIEESKGEEGTPVPSAGTRKGKRGRSDDSEE